MENQMKRREFLKSVGVLAFTPSVPLSISTKAKCENCKFYLPELEVDGYDLLTLME